MGPRAPLFRPCTEIVHSSEPLSCPRARNTAACARIVTARNHGKAKIPPVTGSARRFMVAVSSRENRTASKQARPARAGAPPKETTRSDRKDQYRSRKGRTARNSCHHDRWRAKGSAWEFTSGLAGTSSPNRATSARANSTPRASSSK